MNKGEFIGLYLNKVMLGHGLPYGMAYLNLLAANEEKAEKAWKRYCKKNETDEVKGI